MAASSPDLKAFLVATPFFGGLSDASLDLLIAMLVECRHEAGATVVAEGEPGRSMYVVHSGELVVSKRGASGRGIAMAALGPGDFFGEMTLIEMQNRSASVVAPSSVVRISSASQPMPSADALSAIANRFARAGSVSSDALVLIRISPLTRDGARRSRAIAT